MLYHWWQKCQSLFFYIAALNTWKRWISWLVQTILVDSVTPYHIPCGVVGRKVVKWIFLGQCRDQDNGKDPMPSLWLLFPNCNREKWKFFSLVSCKSWNLRWSPVSQNIPPALGLSILANISKPNPLLSPRSWNEWNLSRKHAGII